MGVQGNLPGKSSWKEGRLSLILKDEADFGKKGREGGVRAPGRGDSTSKGPIVGGRVNRRSRTGWCCGLEMGPVGVSCRGGEQGQAFLCSKVFIDY